MTWEADKVKHVLILFYYKTVMQVNSSLNKISNVKTVWSSSHDSHTHHTNHVHRESIMYEQVLGKET